MTTVRNPLLVGVLAGAWLSLACTPEPFVGRVSHSRYFEYHDREAQPLCPELLPTLDEHAEKVGSTVGFQAGAAGVVRYYKFRDFAELKAAGDCGSGAGACAIAGKVVLTPRAIDLHELSHIYVNRGLSGPSSTLLDEGFAVALSCQPWLDVPSRLIALPGFDDFRAFLILHGDTQPAGGFSSFDYPAVGMFVTYLVHRYGWSRVQALYRAVPAGASAGDFERAFAKTLPISADDAWRAALSTADAPYCLTDWLCAAPSIGPADTDDTSCLEQFRRTFEVQPGQGGVAVSLAGSNDTALVDCGARTAPLWLPQTEQRLSDWISLAPGRYALANLNAHPKRVHLDATFSNSLFSEQCDAAQEVILSAASPTIIDRPNGAFALGFVRVSGHGQQFTLQTGPGGLSPSVRLCAGCGTDAICSQVYPTADSEPKFRIPDGSVLRIEDAPGFPGWSFSFVPTSDTP
ncbi:MAG: hypothetical protein ABI488_11910 [Polyangiaceae bacterium]